MRSIYVSFALLLSFYAVAQERLVVNERFVNNERYWFVGDKGYIKVALSDGAYQIDRQITVGEDAFTIDNFLAVDQDFSIESSVTIENTADPFAAGIVWNYANIDNFDAFVISGNQSFKVIAVRYGTMFDVSDGDVTHSAIKKSGRKNTLKFSREKDSCSFWINGQKVFSTVFPGISYSAHGVYVQKKVRCKFSSFIIRQNQQLHLVENFVGQKNNLGPQVNSKINDSAPLISPDGSTLFFSREEQGARNADIWFSKKNEAGQWSSAVPIGKPLNNKVFNSVISCSPDNRSVLLLNTYAPDGNYKGCCFSISHYDGEHWTVPKDAVIEHLNSYGKWLDATLSADNRTMLLSLQRPGTMGYNDLYVSFPNDRGRWSEPVSLGPTINTSFNEASPFLAADNKTLYFSSTGYPGYGNQDIFMSRRLDDSWTKWSSPVNLGPHINSVGFDAFFSIAANDSLAYLVSNANSIGGTDIFTIKLPAELMPEKVCFLSGKVIDSQTKLPLQAELIYRSLKNEKVQGAVFSESKSGSFQIILPEVDTYYITAERKGYYAQADSVLVTGKGEKGWNKTMVLKMDPIVPGKSLPIRQLYFDRTKATFLPSSIPALDNFYQFMKQNPGIKIVIEGHTDNVGDPVLNQQLSIERAEAVANYLQERGIEKSRMRTMGYGGSKPIEDNSKEETRRWNRRVEFTVLEP